MPVNPQTPQHIGFAFGLEPKKAVEFLESKKIMVKRFNTAGFEQSARAKAVRIANLSSLEMTHDIYQSMVDAKKKGLSFQQWKKDIISHFEKKGWVKTDGKHKELVAPKTGEVFGSPRRLDTIYRTNVQSAYSAARYQTQRDNADSRPYWQYSAINDSRTRPSHSAMSGLIYRYDHPFWQSFYPPNGFNCRCSVIALAPRDIERGGLTVLEEDGEESERIVELERITPKGTLQKNTAYQFEEGRYVILDKGFDTNVGRMTYRPNLDHYPEALAHAFAKKEMGGKAFEWDFKQFEQEFKQAKEKLNIPGKVPDKDLIDIRNLLRREYKFSAGRLKDSDKTLLELETATVWLSDDTLIKQYNSREGQHFNYLSYQYLPDLIYTADTLLLQELKTIRKIYLFKEINGTWYMGVIKDIHKSNELFVESFRRSNMAELINYKKRYYLVR